jgi:hypothetical protein
MLSYEVADMISTIKCNCVITGGAIASMLLGEKVNDYDIYFQDEELAKSVRKYFIKHYPRTDKPVDGLSILMTTSNSITLSHGFQLITRFTGAPEEITSNFDFIHCTNYWT